MKTQEHNEKAPQLVREFQPNNYSEHHPVSEEGLFFSPN
jgi:hypothetical protein